MNPSIHSFSKGLQVSHGRVAWDDRNISWIIQWSSKILGLRNGLIVNYFPLNGSTKLKISSPLVFFLESWKHGEKGFGSHLDEALLLRVLSVLEKSNNASGCKSEVNTKLGTKKIRTLKNNKVTKSYKSLLLIFVSSLNSDLDNRPSITCMEKEWFL